MNITCACGAEYASKTEPCPDGRPSCLVMHYAKDAHVCPKCGADNVPDLSKGVSMEVGLGVGNLAGITKLEMYTERPWPSTAEVLQQMEHWEMPTLRLVESERMYAALGIPREFIEGSANHSTSATAIQVFENTMRRTQREAVERITRPVDLDTEYVEGMTFREFWLKNFPRILALKLGPGPKRLRKKRLKKALGAAYGGHLMAERLRGTMRLRVESSE